MNNKVSSVLNSIEKIDNLIMEADVSVSDAMSDVYSKQFKMEGNVTEDYINHEYYQESVIAGILIGGGIIAVLATAIVLITKHVKKSASGDPEKKNDTSTAAGVSLDKPEEFNKKVEQLKSELEKAGGKLTISDVGFDASKLKQKYEMIKELCGYAETFLKGTEDDEIDGALNEFNKKLEEINGIDYKLSGEVEVTPASLDEIKSLAAPIQQMTANLEKVSKEFEKRSKENKNANTGEMDDAKKERFEKLKEGLNQINKGSTDLGKSVDNEFSIIRKYFEAVSKAAKEKAKPTQAESEKQSSKQSSSKTPDEILNTVIQTHPAYKSYENDAEILGYISKLLVDSPHMVENPESPKAKTLLMTFKNKKPIDDNNELIEMSLTRDVTKELLREIGWPEDKINEIRFSDENEERIKNVLSNYKPGESEHKSEETGSPKTDENSQEIDLSQEDMKNIAEFANTFILQGKNKKGTATMPKDEVKNILSEITRSIKSSQYDDINDKIFELFNKQDNIDLKSIFVDLMLTAKNPIFKGKAPSESLLSDMEKIASDKTIETEELKLDSLSTITKDPAEILDTVIQNNPNYKKYENDQYVINTIIPTFSKMRYEELVQTVQSVKPGADIIQASLFRDIAKEIAKEQGWTDKIDNIKLSDENEKRIKNALSSAKSLPTVSDVLDDVNKAVEQFNKAIDPMKTSEINETDKTFQSFKDDLNYIKTNGLEDVFNAIINANNINLNDQISQSTYLLLVILKDITIRCYEHESELNILLSSLYANGDQTLNPISFEAVKTYAEMRGISVTLTKPDGTQVEVGTKSDVKNEENDNKNQSSESRLSFVTTDTERAINAANQRNEQGVPLINDNEAKALRNANYDSWGFIEYYIFTKQHKKLNDLPFTRRLVKQLAQMAYRANKMEAMRNDLKRYLMNMYSKYTDPTAKQRIYDEACTFVKYHPGLTAEVIDPDGNVKILNDPNEDWNV